VSAWSTSRSSALSTIAIAWPRCTSSVADVA